MGNIGTVNKKTISWNDVALQNSPLQADPVVKTAILTTIAGYLENDQIVVHGDRYFLKEDLEDFLSYLLNDSRAAPREYDIELNFTESKPQNKTDRNSKVNNFDCAIAFSGGLDSTAGMLYALDNGFSVLPIWIGLGQKNEEHELITVRRLSKKLGLTTLEVKIDLSKFIDQDWKRWKLGIIPARNFLFSSVAAHTISDSSRKNLKIFICAHKEEITNVNTDKSERFFKSCSEIFSIAYDKLINVTSPFKRYTKSEIISYWQRVWSLKYNLIPSETVSCYFGNDCGECKACINRLVALTCANSETATYKNDPFQNRNNIFGYYLDRFDVLPIIRRLEILHVLHKNKQSLPRDIKNFVDDKYHAYSKKIDKHLKNIESVNIR